MRVKGLMPSEDGISQETPTGRAVGRNLTWHNFLCYQPTSYAMQILLSILLYFLNGFSLGSVNG